MPVTLLRRSLTALAPMLLLGTFTLVAQVPADFASAGIQLSRQDLEQRLATYEQTAQSSAYSSELRSLARAEAALIQTRLTEGDFKVGDQITLNVEGEAGLSEIFLVTAERTLDLPQIGAVPLDGVLRSELEPYLTKQIGRFVREPTVRARALFRITITGAVGSPGFYVVPAEALLTDALMAAGGPSGQADLKAIRIERAGKPIWRGEALQKAITEGRTLDQLSLGAGDHIVVPSQKSGGVGRNLLYALSAASSIIMVLTRVF